MTIAIDTNILIALWNEDDALNREAERALEEASAESSLVISAPVYVELRMLPGRDESRMDNF